MIYTITYQERALAEYELAMNWYRQRSDFAAENFEIEVLDKINTLRLSPENFKKTYKQFHEVSLRKYPYSIVYVINVKSQSVIISSIFHHKRNPRKNIKQQYNHQSLQLARLAIKQIPPAHGFCMHINKVVLCA